MYTYEAIVTDVYDGDTITVDIDLGFGIWFNDQKVRLHGIDTPEVRGPERSDGLVSRDWLRDKILDQKVTIRTIRDSKGKFGRWLASVYPRGETLSVNDQLVSLGLAERKEY